MSRNHRLTTTEKVVIQATDNADYTDSLLECPCALTLSEEICVIGATCGWSFLFLSSVPWGVVSVNRSTKARELSRTKTASNSRY